MHHMADMPVRPRPPLMYWEKEVGTWAASEAHSLVHMHMLGEKKLSALSTQVCGTYGLPSPMS